MGSPTHIHVDTQLSVADPGRGGRGDSRRPIVGCVAQWLERRSLTSELSLASARSVADVTTYVGITSAIGQPTRPTQPFILPGSINE